MHSLCSFSCCEGKNILYKCGLAQPRHSLFKIYFARSLHFRYFLLGYVITPSLFGAWSSLSFPLPCASVPAPPLLRLSLHFLFSVSPQGSRGWHLTKEQMEAPCLPQTLLTHCWTLILPHYCRMTLWSRNGIGRGKCWQVLEMRKTRGQYSHVWYGHKEDVPKCRK